jgi:hypothetical protein
MDGGVYRQLAADDPHILSFLFEPHVSVNMPEVYAAGGEYIERT